MSVKLLTEHHLGFLTLKRGHTRSSESTLVKMPHCCKSHVSAQLCSYWHNIFILFTLFLLTNLFLIVSLLSCGCIVLRLYLAVPWVGLRSVIVAFPCHTHLPFLICYSVGSEIYIMYILKHQLFSIYQRTCSGIWEAERLDDVRLTALVVNAD